MATDEETPRRLADLFISAQSGDAILVGETFYIVLKPFDLLDVGDGLKCLRLDTMDELSVTFSQFLAADQVYKLC